MSVGANTASSAEQWTAALTALAGPVGSIGLAFVVGRTVEASAGGMGDLVAVLAALWLGGPVLAIIVFGVCLLTLLREVALRRGLALAVFAVAAIAQLVIVLIALRLLGDSGEAGIFPIVVAAMSALLLGVGALFALKVARR